MKDIDIHLCMDINDLGQSIGIQSALWIYDSENNFIGSFNINFCPICGYRMEKKHENE